MAVGESAYASSQLYSKVTDTHRRLGISRSAPVLVNFASPRPNNIK